MKATQYTGIYAGKNAVRVEFTYRHQRCRETIKVQPTEGNLRRLNQHLNEVKLAIQIGKFEYSEYFPESKKAYEFSGRKSSLLTLKQVIEQWYSQSYGNWRSATEKTNRARIYKYLIPVFGHLKVEDFKPSHFREWRKSVHLKPKTINDIQSLMRQAFQFLVYDEIIEKNPIDCIRRLNQQRPEPDPFSSEERAKILKALPKGYARDFYEFAFWSGLRTGEQIGLKWENVDLDNKRVFIRESVVGGMETGLKTNSSKRTVELNSYSLEVLKRIKSYSQPEPHVFLDPRTLRRWKNDGHLRERFWINALKSANVRYRVPYNCRHSFASQMLSDGKNPMWVATQMGHSDWGQIRMTYGRWIT